MFFQRYQKSKTDWYAFYHKRLEAKGENVQIGADYRSVDPKLNKSFLFSHSSCDADGALRQGMIDIGYSASVFPKSKPLKSPSLRKVWPTLFKFLASQLPRPRRLHWKFGSTTLPFKTFGPRELLFSMDETQAILAYARKNRVDYTSILFWALSNSVASVLLEKPSQQGWHIPVNIRGWKKNTPTDSNQLTNFVQFVGPNDSCEQIQAMTFAMLRKGWHFANIFFMNIGDWPGFAWVLKLKILLDYAKITPSEQIAGTFSSIGRWPKKGTKLLHETDTVVPFGNVTLKNPVCLVNILWDERICLTVQGHSSVCDSAEQVDKVVQVMKKNIFTLIEDAKCQP